MIGQHFPVYKRTTDGPHFKSPFTWAGCGLHIDQALAGLKDEEICKCKESKQKAEDIPDLIKLV
ncbi:hypothetical protein A0J61_02830 [Choanephora cucurbitarum]|uniref:Uncharacterized protein n=1 Tax=Choanephora cucurbitarum TaxID=101091 RepID=A0A1C7NJ45_9FUNG|nr:hypothetical protein A0J61_02830 [Choanephora cucurbitarum]